MRPIGIKYGVLYILMAVVAAAFMIYKYDHTLLADVLLQRYAIFYNYSSKTRSGREIKVARVIDGDTIELVNGDRLRYIGIDAPEEFDPEKPVQCFAKEASMADKNLVEGKKITFYNDISDRDRYGRLLGFVYLSDGTFVNRRLVEEGFAFAYPYQPDISHAKEFKVAETKARQANRGLWNTCTVNRTPAGREQTNAI